MVLTICWICPAGADEAPVDDAVPSEVVENPGQISAVEGAVDATRTEAEIGVEAAAEPDAEAEDWLDSLEDSDVVGDELLLFEDIPIVVTGSRQKTRANVQSIPVTIITAEDIHYSGLTELPEILQFASGVQVVRSDRNHYAVGIRGLHDVFSDRTLVLIDGRSAYNPVFGGAEWFRLPVMVEDIERIEVVRGPAGAAWGANAFNGVINIITKDMEDTLGFFGTTTWTEHHDNYSQFRWGAKQGKWAWRTSLGFLDYVDSEAGGGSEFQNTRPTLWALIGAGGFRTSDFRRTWIVDNVASYKLAPETKVKFGVAASDVQMGNVEIIAYRPTKDKHYETTRGFVKIEREDPDGNGGYLQWFGNIERSNGGGSYYVKTFENDLEGQVDLATSETNKLSFGGNVRLMHILDRRPADPQAIRVRNARLEEALVGLFVVDRWQATDRLTLEGQLRGDWYSETHCDWSSRLSALYALDAEKRHIVRLSGAKAFRSPFAAWRRMSFSHAPVFPGFYAINIAGSTDLRNEEVYSIEGGYTGQLAKGVSVRADAYYQRYLGLIDTVGRISGGQVASFDNVADADAWGVECELKLKNDIGQVSAWYNYNVVRLDDPEVSTRSYLTSPHSVGLTGRLFLPHDTTFNANFRYSDLTRIGMIGWDVDVPKMLRLDMTLSKKVGEHAEFMVGVSDILNDTVEPHSSVGVLFPHETPGRTLFARFQISF